MASELSCSVTTSDRHVARQYHSDNTWWRWRNTPDLMHLDNAALQLMVV